MGKEIPTRPLVPLHEARSEMHLMHVHVAINHGVIAGLVYAYLMHHCGSQWKMSHTENAWIYVSAADLQKGMPYVGIRQIQRSLRSLTEAQLILTKIHPDPFQKKRGYTLACFLKQGDCND